MVLTEPTVGRVIEGFLTDKDPVNIRKTHLIVQKKETQSIRPLLSGFCPVKCHQHRPQREKHQRL